MAEYPLRDGHASQRVIALCIETGRDRHDVGLEKIGYRGEHLLERKDITVIVQPVGHGNINGVAHSISLPRLLMPAGARVVGELVGGEIENGRV